MHVDIFSLFAGDKPVTFNFVIPSYDTYFTFRHNFSTHFNLKIMRYMQRPEASREYTLDTTPAIACIYGKKDGFLNRYYLLDYIERERSNALKSVSRKCFPDFALPRLRTYDGTISRQDIFYVLELRRSGL
jgi:hypothetical protein